MNRFVLPLLLLILGLASANCQTMPPTLQALRVPEVIGTVKVNIDGGSHSVVVDPRTGYVYAFKSGAINILKGKELVGRIGTSNDLPESVALDEVGGYLYVVRNRNRDTVMVIQGTEIIGTVTLTGQQLASVAIEPETHLAYVVGADLRTNLRDNPVAEGIVTIMNRTQIIQSINVGRIPLDQIVADPVGGYMYAGNASGIGIGTVIVFKGSKEVARNKISSVDEMNVNPRTGEVFVRNYQTWYRFKDAKLFDSVNVENYLGKIWRTRVHPITGDLYVFCGSGSSPKTGPGIGHVLVLRQMKQFADIKVESGPFDLAIDPFTGNVYAVSDEGSVTVVYGTEVVSKIKAGYPVGLGINPANGWVYLLTDVSGAITILGYPEKTTAYPSNAYPSNK